MYATFFSISIGPILLTFCWFIPSSFLDVFKRVNLFNTNFFALFLHVFKKIAFACTFISFYLLHAALDIFLDTENIKLVFCAVKDTIMQSALKEFNLAWILNMCSNIWESYCWLELNVFNIACMFYFHPLFMFINHKWLFIL